MRQGQQSEFGRFGAVDARSGLRAELVRVAGLAGSFALAAVAAVAPMMNAIYDDSFSPARLAVVLVALLGAHLLSHPKVFFGRECVLYLLLLVYMTISALWTSDSEIANNTLVPALNYLVILVLFGSLVTFHNLRAVLSGMLFGFLFGAAIYTVAEGFPFVRPPDFSYNAIAGMYLFGLFTILAWGWHVRSKLLSMLMAIAVMMLIAATTSIKTNLGVLLGALAAAVIYLRTFAKVLGGSVVALTIVSIGIGYTIASNDALFERLQQGTERVAAGAKILSERQDVSKNTSFNQRQNWQEIGLAGWLSNPVFGSGVEAFRADVGVTSHSTPIDVLYNFGVIGFALFYGIFATLGRRLYLARGTQIGALPILVFSGAICYLFMSLAEPLYYSSFFAIFVAVSAALLRGRSDSLKQEETNS